MLTSSSQWEKSSLSSSRNPVTCTCKPPNLILLVTVTFISCPHASSSLIKILFHLGIALSHNPVGLAAYILEKFQTWVDGGLDNRHLHDAIFDNIMIYYLTNSITTSVRLYAEAFTKEHLNLKMDQVPMVVPAGCARFKGDLAHQFDWQLHQKFPKLVHSTYYRKGAHFAALEQPDVLYNDFTQFVKKLNITK